MITLTKAIKENLMIGNKPEGETKSRTDYIRNPATSHPRNRPQWTWSEADINLLKHEAKAQAEKLSRSRPGTNKASQDAAHAYLMQELQKLMPQPEYQSGADLFGDDDEMSFEERAAAIRELALRGSSGQ